MTFNWNSEKFQRPSMNAALLTAGRRFIFPPQIPFLAENPHTPLLIATT
jgi:hypothetical protein